MNLIVNWTSPIPYPVNNFQIFYRRNYDPFYTSFNTSGTTSGSTYLINVSAPANYEGYIQSSCAGETVSDHVPFGVNAYQSISITINIVGSTAIGMGTTLYPNSYPILIDLTVNYHIGITPETLTGTVTYPAGVTTFQVLDAGIDPAAVIDSFVVNSIVPVFDNGGQLQQLDNVSTPPYIKTYWNGNTSGTTWNGSPLILPSFTLEAFNVTAVDPENNPVAGNLIVTWIADSIYHNAVSPYNQVTFTVYDPDSSVMGSSNAYPSTLGLQTAVIPMNLVSAPLNTSTEFTMTTQWGDTTLSATVVFYLPNF